MFTVIQDIINRARFELPGATDASINLALFDAMNEWCRRTDANKFVAEVPIQEGVIYYQVLFVNSVVVRVFKVGHTRMSLAGAYDADEAQLVLYDAPSAEDALTPMYIEVSLAPKPGADDPDKWMIELLWIRHATVILDGVIAKMASQIAKPYSNQTKAVFHGKRFHNGMASSKAQSNVGYDPGGQNWRFPIVK